MNSLSSTHSVYCRWHRALALLVLLWPTVAANASDRLRLRTEHLDLPAAPAVILSHDVNGDGRQDLAVVVAYTEWDQIGVEESTEMDGVEGLVEVLTIVPSLADRRELHLFLAQEDGGFVPAGSPLDLDTSVLTIDVGPPGLGLFALTDEGLSSLHWRADSTPSLVFEPVAEERPVLAGTGAFLPQLGLVRDLDGDGVADLLFPGEDGLTVYQSPIGEAPKTHLDLPSDRLNHRDGLSRFYPIPEVRDVTGDRLPDLLLPHPELRWRRFYVLRGTGDGGFAPAPFPLVDGEPGSEEDIEPWSSEPERPAVAVTIDGMGDEELEGESPPAEEPVKAVAEGEAVAEEEKKESAEVAPEIVWFGDLDGDHRAEYVTREDLTQEDAGMRQEMRDAKRSPGVLRFHRSRADLSMENEPYLELPVLGYAFDEGEETENGNLRLPGGFQDLDGDGRLDLVSLTLEFSMMQAVRILTVKSLNLGLDFHLWCQRADGSFHPVSGLDLSGRFRLQLNNLRLGHLSQFAGDFDGDGRADFVQMGRGKKVTIHLGREGCSYPPEPDLTLVLDEEPRDLGLVQVRDLNGDGRSDLVVIQPQRKREAELSPRARLDLYLSGETP